MKNSSDNQDMLEYAKEATDKVAEALVESSKTSGAKKSVRFNEEANTIHEIFDALESNNPVNNLEKLDQKNEGVKEHSSISTKIKNFVKSVIKFLKSPFSKQSKAELDQATEETVEEIVATNKERQNSQDQRVESPSTRPAPPPPPERKPMQAAHAEQTKNQRPRTAPPPPPERKPMSHEQTGNSRTPPPPPPPPPPMNNTFKPVGDQKGGFEAIKQGVKLNNAADRKLADAKEPQDKQPDHIGELEARLKARREKSGQEHSAKPSNKFAEDAKLFEAARKEELDRQAKAEKLENEKVAKATADEAAKKAETQSKPAALNLKPGEIPIAPPPPPPPPPPGFQTNTPAVKADPAPAQKNQQQNKGPQQFGVDKDAIEGIRNTLKKASQEPKKVEDQQQTDFRNVLKPKDKSPER